MPQPDQVHGHLGPGDFGTAGSLGLGGNDPQASQEGDGLVESRLRGPAGVDCPPVYARQEPRDLRGGQLGLGLVGGGGSACGDAQPVQAADVGGMDAAGVHVSERRLHVRAGPVQHVAPQAHDERRHLGAGEPAVRAVGAVGAPRRQSERPHAQDVLRSVVVGAHILELGRADGVAQPGSERLLRLGPSPVERQQGRHEPGRHANPDSRSYHRRTPG